MLDIAINHTEELKQKFRSVWYSNQYYCFTADNRYNEYKMWDSTNEELDKHQYVSIKDGQILAFLEYDTLKGTNQFCNLNAMDFQNKMSMDFYNDLMQVTNEFIKNTKWKYIYTYILFGEPVKRIYHKISKDFEINVIEPDKRHIQMIIEGFYNKKIEKIFGEDYNARKNRN